MGHFVEFLKENFSDIILETDKPGSKKVISKGVNRPIEVQFLNDNGNFKYNGGSTEGNISQRLVKVLKYDDKDVQTEVIATILKLKACDKNGKLYKKMFWC